MLIGKLDAGISEDERFTERATTSDFHYLSFHESKLH